MVSLFASTKNKLQQQWKPKLLLQNRSSNTKKIHVGTCSRLLVLAAMFWLVMQVALIPKSHHDSNSQTINGKNNDNNNIIINSNNNNIINNRLRRLVNRRIIYVHVGKTGGEWIKSQLSVVCNTRKNVNLVVTCLDRFQKQENPPIVSLQTIGYLHVHSQHTLKKMVFDSASHYLFSVRHPLKRLISWYIYNHPSSCDMREANSPSCKDSNMKWKKEFFDCFPTLDEWGKKITYPKGPITIKSTSKNVKSNGKDNKNKNSNNDEVMDHCNTIFWNGWKGEVSNLREPNHLYWNYKYYWDQTVVKTPKKKILVVRQEFLEQDMNRLEVFLAGSGDEGVQGDEHLKQQNVVNVPQVSWNKPDSIHYLSRGKVSLYQSPQSIRNLCCALWKTMEITIYNQLLEKAENLSEQDKAQSLEQSTTICEITNWDECKQ